MGPNVNLLLTPDLNVVQMRTIVIVVIVVNIVCRQLRTAKAEKNRKDNFLRSTIHVVLRTKKVKSQLVNRMATTPVNPGCRPDVDLTAGQATRK